MVLALARFISSSPAQGGREWEKSKEPRTQKRRPADCGIASYCAPFMVMVCALCFLFVLPFRRVGRFLGTIYISP
jgi:hypothetical protein